jgi:hypothetical protein
MSLKCGISRSYAQINPGEAVLSLGQPVLQQEHQLVQEVGRGQVSSAAALSTQVAGQVRELAGDSRGLRLVARSAGSDDLGAGLQQHPRPPTDVHTQQGGESHVSGAH